MKTEKHLRKPNRPYFKFCSQYKTKLELSIKNINIIVVSMPN